MGYKMQPETAPAHRTAECSQCGQRVTKLVPDPRSGGSLCLRCISKAGPKILADLHLTPSDDRRGAVRVPLTVAFNIRLDTEYTSTIRYPAKSVDLSVSGICFAWKLCGKCPGRPGHGVHSDCIFNAHAAANPAARPLTLEFSLPNGTVIEASAVVVHVQHDPAVGLDYVGACFTEVDNQTRRMLEKIVIRFAEI